MAKTKGVKDKQIEIAEQEGKAITCQVSDNTLRYLLDPICNKYTLNELQAKLLVGALTAGISHESDTGKDWLAEEYNITVNGIPYSAFMKHHEADRIGEISKLGSLAPVYHSGPFYGGSPFVETQSAILPGFIDNADMLNTILAIDTSAVSVLALTQLAGLTDESLAGILGMTVKTLRSYKQPTAIIKGVLKEHVIYLHTLFSHGNSVFGTKEAFTAWLIMPNFLLDSKAPVSFISSITGTKFIDTRLTALEYGDNV